MVLRDGGPLSHETGVSTSSIAQSPCAGSMASWGANSVALGPYLTAGTPWRM